MKYVKLFENWMEDEDGDQTVYADAPVAQMADAEVADTEMDPEFEVVSDEAPSDEETYADGIGYDDSEVEEENEEE